MIARDELRPKKHGHAVVVMRSDIERYIKRKQYLKTAHRTLRASTFVCGSIVVASNRTIAFGLQVVLRLRRAEAVYYFL